jgi:glycosyltransferase involved in cell wall biosynthesis
MSGLTIVIPVLNEGAVMDHLHRHLQSLAPPPDEVIVVDGGSEDGTLAMAEAFADKALLVEPPGRARQINAGVEAASGDLVMVLHADTQLPSDAVAVAKDVLSDPKISLAGFTAILEGPAKTRWVTSFHNWLKTWYAPLLFRPHLFVKGCRLLFGDHAMFFRREDFLAVGGCDPAMTVMEEADLCVKLTGRGRVRLIDRIVRTSDRRVAAWGGLKANWIYLQVGARWGLGLRKRLGDRYPDVR